MTQLMPGVKREDLAPVDDPAERRKIAEDVAGRAREREGVVDALFDLEADSKRAIEAFPVGLVEAREGTRPFVKAAVEDGHESTARMDHRNLGPSHVEKRALGPTRRKRSTRRPR